MAGRRRLSRRMTLVVVAVVVVGGTAGGVWWRNSGTGASAATPTTQTATATLQAVKQTVTADGTIEPATQSDLSFASGGTVTSVKVEVGDRVTAGQAVATIDPTDLQDSLAAAKATLAAAQAALTTAESGGSASQLASAQAQVAAAQAKVTSAQSALSGATLSSPIAGTVAAVDLVAGSTVGSGSSSGSGGSAGSGGSSGGGAAGASSGTSEGSGSSSSSAQVTVISTASWVVKASVGSADLASLKKGLQATVTPTGSATPVFGTVSTVGVVASSSSGGTATFPVTVAVTGSPTGLYAGGSATVAITTRQIADALTIPTAAVSSSGGAPSVQLVKNGTTTTTPVTLGLVSGQVTQVTAGLKEGDQVSYVGRTVGGTRGTGGTGGTGTRQGGGGGGGGFGGGGTGGAPGVPPGGAVPGGN